MLGDRLRKSRMKASLTQEELGNKIGVSGASVSYYETGQRVPTMETFLMILEVLSISADYLLGYDRNVVSDNEEYHIKMSVEEIKFIKEIRLKREVHNKILEDPKRAADLLYRRVK